MSHGDCCTCAMMIVHRCTHANAGIDWGHACGGAALTARSRVGGDLWAAGFIQKGSLSESGGETVCVCRRQFEPSKCEPDE